MARTEVKDKKTVKVASFETRYDAYVKFFFGDLSQVLKTMLISKIRIEKIKASDSVLPERIQERLNFNLYAIERSENELLNA